MLNRKNAALILASIMCTSLLAACVNSNGSSSTASKGGSSNAGADTIPATDEKVTLTLGWLNFKSSADDEYWPTMITEELEKKLNIKLEAVGYDEEKLNLDLAAGTSCDVMMVYKKHVDGVLRGGHAEPMDSYLGAMPNTNAERMNYRNSIMREYRSNGDGKLYFRTSQVTEEGNGEPVGAGIPYGHGVRWDLYKQIGAPDITTSDQWIDALKKMQEINPKTKEGLPVYGVGMYNDADLHTWIFQGLLELGLTQLDGNSIYLTDAVDNSFIPNIYEKEKQTAYWNDMKMFNRMYREGLMDPDCFITKGEDITSKYEKGQYLGGYVNWHWGKWNDKVNSDNPEAAQGFAMLPTRMIWGGSEFKVGWDDKMYFVSSHSKQKERTMMLMDYFDNPEFARLLFSGKEGEQWEYDANKVPVIKQEVIDLKGDPSRAKEWSKLGINTTYTNTVGCAQGVTFADGYPVDLWQAPEILSLGLKSTDIDFCKTMNVSYPNEYALKMVEEGKSINQSKVNASAKSLMPQAPSDIARIDSNIMEMAISAIPSLVQATDDAAFETAKAKLMSDLEGAGAQTATDWWRTNWETTLAAANSIDK